MSKRHFIENMKTIILAGGSGSRLWPLSRGRYPKQFIKLHRHGTSLFQETFKRSLMISSIDDIYIVTNNAYKCIAKGEIEELGYECNEENIIIEPEAKNTLPAIYAGVNEIAKKGKDSVVVFPSDHMIENSEKLVSNIMETEKLLDNFIVTFGIKPNEPNVGYGYISPGKAELNGFKVKEFKEKPTYKKALEYIEKGYFWNAGIFMFNSKLFSDEVKAHENVIYNAFEKSMSIEEAFSKINTKISIDYGIMEKSSKVAVVPVEIGWNDLGSFDSFYDVYKKDDFGNVTSEENILIDSKDNFIQTYDDKMVATIGVNDLVIIDNRDALLVCKKNQTQKVKEVVEKMKERKDSRLEYNIHGYRPWGYYKILEEEKHNFKIKRITVKPGKKLGYQLHYHRSEHWIVVKGMAKVVIDDESQLVRAGESIFFKMGQKHSLENPGKILLEIVEIQMGEYLEKDDIIRFEDQ